MSFEEVLKLPFEIQLVLAAGYLAYRVAVTGLDRAHKTTDVVFQVLAYGLVAYVAYDILSLKAHVGIAMAVAVFAAIAAAGLWRGVARRWFVKMARGARVTRENFYPSTWSHIIHEPNDWAYVSVVTVDGMTYESDLAVVPIGVPYDPLDVDVDGNIAIYVTRTISRKGTITDHGVEGVLDNCGRAHLTYVPASRIKAITVSLATDLSPPTGASTEEEEAARPASSASPGSQIVED